LSDQSTITRPIIDSEFTGPVFDREFRSSTSMFARSIVLSTITTSTDHMFIHRLQVQLSDGKFRSMMIHRLQDQSLIASSQD